MVAHTFTSLHNYPRCKNAAGAECPGLSKRMGSMKRSLMSVTVVTLSAMAVASAEQHIPVSRGAP
jgi:hypothetical protein